MSRALLAALALLVLSADLARAQFSGPYAYQDGGASGFNIVPEYEGRRSYADIQRDLEIERRYKETLRTRIPDKKPSNDPWRGVRAAPASADRHRVE